MMSRLIHLVALVTILPVGAFTLSSAQLTPRSRRVSMLSPQQQDLPSSMRPTKQQSVGIKKSMMAQSALAITTFALFSPVISIAFLFLGPALFLAGPALLRDQRMDSTVAAVKDACLLLAPDESGVHWYACPERPDDPNLVCEFSFKKDSENGIGFVIECQARGGCMGGWEHGKEEPVASMSLVDPLAVPASRRAHSRSMLT
eukprot:CAMPEP_0119064968 /NCGR_PEP_ID=MMETSP1178-20130426/7899_1 /TAXON_ID=33656 /ORGANISM="unid sp, Strain CCMP2000" /LENGTH=201 /DNA_ID=CAMNT_0007046447 /DNA_START=23 /DNA_END=629 /DNA_ORIENTATION=-